MKRPTLTLELRALLGRGRQRELASRAAAGIRKLAVEQEPHFDFIADRMELGVHRLMQFPQTPDSLFRHVQSS